MGFLSVSGIIHPIDTWGLSLQTLFPLPEASSLLHGLCQEHSELSPISHKAISWPLHPRPHQGPSARLSRTPQTLSALFRNSHGSSPTSVFSFLLEVLIQLAQCVAPASTHREASGSDCGLNSWLPHRPREIEDSVPFTHTHTTFGLEKFTINERATQEYVSHNAAKGTEWG